MAMDVIETHDLIKIVETRKPKSSYWLDLCFPTVHTFNTEYVDFDLVDNARRLAPFVAPTVQGQPMVHRGHSVRKFKPAYIKPKDPVDPGRILKRRAGELFGGAQLTPAQRHDAIVADILFTHVDGIERRWEWMAAKAVIDGAVTISGENYPTVQLAFGRHASNTKTLTGTALWTDTVNSKPLDAIDAWNTEMMDRCGYPITRLTMGPMAFSAFINHPQVKEMLDVRRGGTTTFEIGPGDGQPVQYRGTLKSANIDIYVYSDKYEDNLGVAQDFLNTNDVVATNAAVDGVRAFGAIMDKKANWQAVPIFSKMWEQEDPSGLFVMSQSAPLMIPSRPNASMKITVR
jgi:hypothetical protein